MELESYRKIIVAIGLIGLLLFASPTIAIFVKSPSGQPFSELYPQSVLAMAAAESG